MEFSRVIICVFLAQAMTFISAAPIPTNKVQSTLNHAPSPSLLAYDCSNLDVQRTISADQVQACRDPHDWQSRQTYGVVVQSVTTSQINLYACSVKSVTSIAHCGMHSHSSLTTNSVTIDVEPVGREACIQAHKMRLLDFDGHTIRNLELNATTRAAIVVEGSRNAAGECTPGSFTYRNTQYTKATMEKDLEITLFSTTAKLDVRTNKIILDNGVQCDYAELTCSHNGIEFHWEPQFNRKSCSTEYEYLTTGPVTIFTMPNAYNVSEQYLSVNYSDYLFALKLTASTKICNFNRAFMTEHSKLFFIETDMDTTFPQAQLNSLELTLYLNSKFLYHEIAIKQDLNTLARELVTKRCEIDRQARLNMLAIARSEPNRLATFFNDPALISYLAGEVLYISRCRTVFVSVRSVSLCYNALPVSDPYGHDSFVAPFTHKLVPFAEEIPCNPLLCPKFRFNNTWIEVCPDARLVHEPEILEPNQNSIQFSVEGRISSAGIYSVQTLQQYQNLMTFGETRQAITSSMSRMASGNSPAENASWLQNLFPAEQAKNMIKSAYRTVFGWFSEFFWYLSGISGILSMITIIRYILTVIFNAFHLKNVAGCSAYTCLAFCGPCAKIFIHQKLKEQLETHANEKFHAIEKHVLNLQLPVTSQPPSRHNSISELWAEQQGVCSTEQPVIIKHNNCCIQ